MDPEDPDGPDPSVVQYRSSLTALADHHINLKVDRIMDYCT
jgi:hypothetical protein